MRNATIATAAQSKHEAIIYERERTIEQMRDLSKAEQQRAADADLQVLNITQFVTDRCSNSRTLIRCAMRVRHTASRTSSWPSLNARLRRCGSASRRSKLRWRSGSTALSRRSLYAHLRRLIKRV